MDEVKEGVAGSQGRGSCVGLSMLKLHVQGRRKAVTCIY